MGDTAYECAHEKGPGKWMLVDAYEPEEAATEYCRMMIKRDWETAPLTTDGDDCTVFVRPVSDPADETKWTVRCEFDTPSFYADEA